MSEINLRGQDNPEVLPNCPFRTYRQVSEDELQGLCKEIICEAGGGFVLGSAESVNATEICQACDIPISLNLRYACLYVVPFRIFEDDHVQSYYGCRWYFGLNSQKAPKNMEWCIGCRDWFPRPQKFLVPGQIRASHKFRQIFLNPPKRREFPMLPREEDKRQWYERIRDLFYW